MARVNITVPDDLYARARAVGLNISRLAQAAIADELDRRAKQIDLDNHLRDLESTLGPVPSDEVAAAEEWADRVLGGRSGQQSA